MAKSKKANTSAKAEKTVLSADLKALIATAVADAIAALMPATNGEPAEKVKVNETINNCPLKVGDLVKTPLDCVRKVTAIVSDSQVMVARNGKKDKLYNVKSLTKISKSQAKAIASDNHPARMPKNKFIVCGAVMTYGKKKSLKLLKDKKLDDNFLNDIKKYRKENKMGRICLVDAIDVVDTPDCKEVLKALGIA